MNPFLLPSQERLDDWKRFRTTLKTLPEKEQLEAVASYFAQAPTAKFAYDPEDCTSWPSPWQMISDGLWCGNSVAIGMEFTLRLSGWDSSRLSLEYIKDVDNHFMGLVLVVDGVYILNHEYAHVVELSQVRAHVINLFRYIGKQYKSL